MGGAVGEGVAVGLSQAARAAAISSAARQAGSFSHDVRPFGPSSHPVADESRRLAAVIGLLVLVIDHHTHKYTVDICPGGTVDVVDHNRPSIQGVVVHNGFYRDILGRIPVELIERQARRRHLDRTFGECVNRNELISYPINTKNSGTSGRSN